MSMMPNFLHDRTPPPLGAMLTVGFALFLELGMAILFFSIYGETVNFLGHTYLSELPVLGVLFQRVAPDANASHLVCGLLAIFSVLTPLFLWSQLFEQRIFEQPQAWFSHPQNKVIAGLSAFILLLVIGMECLSLYTLIAREGQSGQGFITTAPTGVMAWLAQNKGMAIGVSIMIAIINITLALFTTLTLRRLRPQEISS